MTGLWCVVPAAGQGRRVGGDRPKQHQSIAGKTLLQHTLGRLAEHPRIAGLVVVVAADDAHGPGPEPLHGKPVRIVVGGRERSDSVLAGLQALGADVPDDAFVLVHDAARPCVRATDIDRLIAEAVPAGGGLLGAPLRDTLKHVGEDRRSQGTEPRERRWRVFTPQMFRRGELTAALQQARDAGVVVSDEAMAMELAGFAPLLVEGAEDNIKVTTAADFALAEFLLGRTR
jgi:2-C-methyl-D-erythritol 4-phosphate cytidylyltransferase